MNEEVRDDSTRNRGLQGFFPPQLKACQNPHKNKELQPRNFRFSVKKRVIAIPVSKQLQLVRIDKRRVVILHPFVAVPHHHFLRKGLKGFIIPALERTKIRCC